jgi:hypothetical protein
MTSLHSVALESATRAVTAPRPGRRSASRLARWHNTPERIRGIVAIALVLTLTLGIVTALIFASVARGIRVIGNQAAPEVVATTDLYYRLNDMDAQVANVLLVGSKLGLGIDRRQALAIFEQDRTQADLDLQRAAIAAGTSPSAQRALRSVLNGLGQYESLVGQAIYIEGMGPSRPGRPPAAALALYRQATDLLQDHILPAASGLTTANAATLSQTYQARRSLAERGALLVLLIGLALIGLLAALQLYISATHRRLLAPALLAATLAAVLLTVTGSLSLEAEASHLKVAKQEAFDSILALSQARAVSDNANADESRFLVDPGRAAQYQDAFERKSQSLVRLAGVPSVFQYDAALARAVNAYRANHGRLLFHGYFGVEFRNITFPGERAAAYKTLLAYQVYEKDDRHIRALNRSGNLSGAIAFDTSYAHGNSNWAFTQYDNALLALIGINQRAFNAAITGGEHGASGWNGPIPLGGTVIIVVLMLAGARPRLAEYR